MKRKTKIKLGLLTLLLVGVGGWVASRWNACFYNSPEAPYIPSATPHRVLLTFGNDGPQSRNISWQCDTVLRPSYLEVIDPLLPDTFRKEANGEVFESRSGKAAYYSTTLRHLRNDGEYRYRVVTGGKASPWYTFCVPDDTRNSISFLFFGDIQDTIGGKTKTYITEAVDHYPDTDMLLFGGDFIERPKDLYYEEAFRGLGEVAQTIPSLVVPGNHEYLKYPIRKLERRFSLVFSYFLNSMIGENHVYTLQYGDAQIYLLDSNRELPYLITQREWLKKELAQSKARWNIVVLHHPVYSIKSSTNNLVQRAVFADVLNDNVDLVLQGHEHAYARMTQHENGKAVPPVYTVSHCSPKHYRIQFDAERFDRYGCGSQYYQRITISGDTLSMCTYDANTHELYDEVDIVKGEHDLARIVDRAAHLPERLEFQARLGKKKDQRFLQRIAERQASRQAARQRVGAE